MDGPLCRPDDIRTMEEIEVATRQMRTGRERVTLEELVQAIGAAVPKLEATELEYRDKINALKVEHLASLKQLVDRAMDDKDLETAVQLREKIKAAESEIDSPTTAPSKPWKMSDQEALERFLRDTTWEIPSPPIVTP